MSDSSASAKAKEMEKQGGKKEEGKAKSTGSQSADPSLNMDELRELAELVNEHGFTDFEFENENIRVRLSKTPTFQYAQQPHPVPAIYAAPPVQQAAPPQAGARSAETSSGQTSPSAEEDLHKITSPIVGTFYRSAGPDKEPYVKEGSHVTPATIVCIVEAMKLMNEIEAEVTGEVVKIYAGNGQPVEYGQPLFGIRK